MVSDPYIFGQVAAANALSDVYAMGGKPITAMNIVAYPQDGDMEALAEIMRGGAEVVAASGAVIAGGHSISDKPPKYGLSVTGIVHPDKVIMNNTTKEGDVLISTKPLGSGIITGAYRQQKTDQASYEEAIKWMTTLNKEAGEIMMKYPVSSATDITGFGLLGHLNEMINCDISAIVYADKVPYMKEAYRLAEQKIVTGGARRNREFLDCSLEFDIEDEAMQEVLLDPQTSGGLLISVPREHGEAMVKELNAHDVPAAIIGEVVKRRNRHITITYS